MTAAPCTPSPPPSVDCRCICGSLVARLVGGGVEIKCRRCKRTLVVPLPADALGGGPEPALPPSREAR